MAFYIFSTLIILTSIMVIVLKNPFHSAVALIATLLLQSALFAYLGAHFLAAINALVYAGGVAVFILFVIMLLNLTPTRLKWKAVSGKRLISLLGGFYLTFVIFFLLFLRFKGESVVGAPGSIEGFSESVSTLLVVKYAVPFGLTAVLILATIVGAVLFAKKGE